MPRCLLGHARIDTLTSDEIIDQISEAARHSRGGLVVTPNANHLVKLEVDVQFRQAYESATLQVPDGQSLVWASHLIGQPLPERVTGADLLPALLAAADREGFRVAIVGGSKTSSSGAYARAVAEYPRADVLCLSPPQGFDSVAAQEAAVLAEVAAFNPQIVFVCIGTPRGEVLGARWSRKLPEPVVISAGAAVDFYSGQMRRAPKFVQAVGLEWLFRLVHEPIRLWRRYLVENLRFLPIVWRSRRGAVDAC